jgi:hypothetical protein
VLCALVLGACAHRADQPPAGAVLISPNLSLVLPRPSDLGRPVDSAQLVTARYGDETYVFEGHVAATPERFIMVALDSLGRKVMTVTWTDAAVTHEVAPWVPGQLRPENILADMVLMYWPEDAVRRALASSHGVLISDAQRRSVMHEGREIIRIDYAAPGTPSEHFPSLRFRNLVWNYQLDVQTAESVR